MEPTVQLDTSLSLLLPSVKEALACGLIGVVVSTVLYGITVLQAYIYFRSSRDDSVALRCFVALLFILDTVSLALTVSILYEGVVTDFGYPLLLLTPPRSLGFENALTFLIGTMTQCFFAHRLWALSKRNIPLVSGIIILALVALGPALVISVHFYSTPSITSGATIEVRALTGVGNGASMVCDIVITAALCYYLRSKRTGFTRTDLMINRLVVYAVNRGVLTAICQACLTITAVAFPRRFFHFPFAIVIGTLYLTTLLATLNARKAMRGDGDNIVEVGTLVLNRINGVSTTGNGASRRVPSEADGDTTPAFIIDISAGKAMDSDHMRSGDGDA